MSINNENENNALHRRHELENSTSYDVNFSSTTQLDTYFSDEKVIIPEIEKVSYN